MAKNPTITNLTSQYEVMESLNTNFNNIQEAFDNTLSRDGSTPNQMEADLDMNGYSLLNLDAVDATNFSFEGVNFGELVADAEAASVAAQTAQAAAEQAAAEAGASIAVRSSISQAFVDELSDGDKFLAGGLVYQKDITKTGTASCTNDLGVDNVTPFLEIDVRHYGISPGADMSTTLETMAANHPSERFHFRETGNYLISNPVRFNSAIILDFSVGLGETTTNGNGTGAAAQVVRYNGPVSSSAMFTWRSGTDLEIMYGGGIRGWPTLDGLSNISYGVIASSTDGQIHDVAVRLVRFAGVAFLATNGNVSKHNIARVRMTATGSAEVRPANGVLLSGETAAIPGAGGGCTQNRIDVRGLIYDGDMVRLVGNCDNNHFERILAARGAGGVGGAVGMADGAERHPRNNFFEYVVGTIQTCPSSFANQFKGVSETSEITGTGHWHYDTQDYLTGERYISPAKVLKDEMFLTPGGAVLSGTTHVISAALWGAVSYPSTGTTNAFWNGRNFNWGRGEVTGIEIMYNVPSPQSGLQAVFQVQMGLRNLESLGAQINQFNNISLPSVANIEARALINFASPISFSEEDLMLLNVQRNGDSVNDTGTSAVHILGINVLYKGLGPANGRSDLPEWQPSI